MFCDILNFTLHIKCLLRDFSEKAGFPAGGLSSLGQARRFFRQANNFSLESGGNAMHIPPLFNLGHLLVGEDATWPTMTPSSNWGWTWIEVQAPPKRKKSIPSLLWILRIQAMRIERTTFVSAMASVSPERISS
jgi:hypothetical protein